MTPKPPLTPLSKFLYLISAPIIFILVILWLVLTILPPILFKYIRNKLIFKKELT